MKMKSLILLTVVLLSGLTLTACDMNDGEAEKAGEKFDQTTKDIGNDIEDACEEVKEGMNAEDTDC